MHEEDYNNNCWVCVAINISFKTTKESLHCKSRNYKHLGFHLRTVNYSYGYLHLELKIGGNLNRSEPPGCEKWKSERKVWRRLHKYGFTDYMEKLHGSKNSVSHGFARGWSNNRVTLFREIWQIDENLVAKVTGL